MLWTQRQCGESGVPLAAPDRLAWEAGSGRKQLITSTPALLLLLARLACPWVGWDPPNSGGGHLLSWGRALP